MPADDLKSGSRLEQLTEAVEPIRRIIDGRVRALVAEGKYFGGHKRGEDARQQFAKTEGMVDIACGFEPLNLEDIPKLWISIPGTGEEERSLLLLGGPENFQVIFGDISAADFQTLCEYAGCFTVAKCEERLSASAPEHLDAPFNPYFTYRQSYEHALARARRSLNWVDANSDKDLRELVAIF